MRLRNKTLYKKSNIVNKKHKLNKKKNIKTKKILRNNNTLRNKKIHYGGQVISLYNNNRLRGISKSPKIKKGNTNIDNNKFSSTSNCFNHYQNKFIKCYSKFKYNKKRRDKCKTKTRSKSEKCSVIQNKHVFSVGSSNHKKSLPQLKMECINKYTDEKAKCFSVFRRNSFGSIPGILGSNNPTRTCAKKYQKKIEFCKDESNSEYTKKLFYHQLNKYKLLIDKEKIPFIDNEITKNLN